MPPSAAPASWPRSWRRWWTTTWLEKLQVWTPAASLGGVESLAERRRRHSTEPDSVPEGLIRLSVGIEDPEDLYQDLAEALRTGSRP